jgi:tetratricopeptide (TPR) repeat protein
VAVAALVSTALIWREQRRAQAAYKEATEDRRVAREALDALTFQAIDGLSLGRQGGLSDEHRRFLERAAASYERLADRADGRDKETQAGVAEAYMRIGMIRRRLGQQAKAGEAISHSVGLFERLAADYPAITSYRLDLAEAHNTLGEWFETAGRLEEAERAFRRAVDLREQAPAEALAAPGRIRQQGGGYFHLGNVLYLTGRVEESAHAHRRAVELHSRAAADQPDSSYFHHCLAFILARCIDPRFRNPSRAVAAARRAAELDPRSLWAWRNLGVAHYRAGDDRACAEAFERSRVLNPNDDDGFDWFYLAMAYWRLGDRDRARQWYDKATTWVEAHLSQDPHMQRLRAEAAELLGLLASPPRPK